MRPGLATPDGRRQDLSERRQTRAACPEIYRMAHTRPASFFGHPPREPGGRRRTLGDEDFRDPDENARNHFFQMIRNTDSLDFSMEHPNSLDLFFPSVPFPLNSCPSQLSDSHNCQLSFRQASKYEKNDRDKG